MTRWTISLVPGRGLRRADGGVLSLPLRISGDGQHLAVTELPLTPASAEQLHAALCYALDGQRPPDDSLECRQPVRYPGGRQRY
ncbi:hypothetical protein [Streptomyces sp. BRA346]|uniref:hypothetical protein n=1 Tax=Streptomyces sp. BRA346 TaxID=2878199 RepID=UPI0040642E10